jgi:hypothetical protein
MCQPVSSANSGVILEGKVVIFIITLSLQNLKGLRKPKAFEWLKIL